MPNSVADFASVKHVHFIAVCGTATGSLALMFKARGFRVSGSDANVYPPMSTVLEEAGIEIVEGFAAANLEPRPDLVIVGNVVSRGNPEVEQMLERDLNYLSLPQALADFFIGEKKSLVIAGTHGKTTTTAMAAWMLTDAGLDPGMLVGGVTRNFGASYRLGAGDIFVVEGDEYDTAFFDKGPKFLHYRPLHAVLTSLEFDHADIYRDFNHYRSRFIEFLKLIPPNGSVAACIDDRAVRELLDDLATDLRCAVTTYGIDADNCSLRAVAIEDDGETVSFDVLENGKNLGRVKSPSPGRHNVLNALGAFAAAGRVGLSFAAFAEAMACFESVKRRQEIVAQGRGAIVIDDFAHHPTAVAATLAALRRRYPHRRLIGVFEPRSNTSRRNIYQDEFAEAFSPADIAIISGVDHPEKVPEADRLDTGRLAQAIAAHNGTRAFSMSGPEEIFSYLTENLADGDLIVLMSNGGFGGLPKRFSRYLQGSQD